MQSQHLFPLSGALTFGQDLVLTMEELNHFVMSTPAHPNDFQCGLGQETVLTKSFLMFTEPQFHNLSPVNLDTVTFEYAHRYIFPHGCLRNEKLYTALVMVTHFFAKHTTCQKHINNWNNDPILVSQAFDNLNP